MYLNDSNLGPVDAASHGAAMEAQSACRTVPLCVDLDGTLIKTDLLVESFFLLIKSQPLALLKMPFWLLKGKAQLKQVIAGQVEIEASLLPYDGVLLEQLRREQAQGRLLVLVTASPRKFADGVQSHLVLFGEVHATADDTNLSAEKKRDFLVQRFGRHGFDYVGNSRDDIPVWAAARESWLVDVPAAVRRDAKEVAMITREFRQEHRYLYALARELRLHQWLKNILIFVPLIASHQLVDPVLLTSAVVAFLAFGLCASSVYVLNDLLDLSADRHHPRKRKRAFAAGILQPRDGLLLIPALLAVAMLLSLMLLPWVSFAVLAAYFVMTLAYSFWAKERAVVDVLFLTSLYSMRLVAGAAATGIELSFWLMAFSTFLFLSLAMIKRYSEMLSVRRAGQTHCRGRGYSIDDMPLIQSMGITSGYMAVIVLALYIHGAEVVPLYAQPKILWALCPLMLFWISRVWLKSCRGEMLDDPVVFAAKDRCSQISGLICGVTLWLAA